MTIETNNHPKVKLYGYPTSPFVLKVGCYLKYKQISFEFIPVHPITREQIAFTQQQQVPVLSIGNQWKCDSSPIGIWLDQQFPERPILGTNESEKALILSMDQWISDQLLPSRFRVAIYWDGAWNALRNGWMLASAMNNAIAIPWYLRVFWPLLIKRAAFLKRMVNKLDLKEPLWDMHQRLADELTEHLAEGPFLGGLKQPSLADLSAYPIVMFAYLMKLHGRVVYLERPEIVQWCQTVQSILPANPLLMPDEFLNLKPL